MLGRRFDDSYCPTIEDYHIKLFKIKSEYFRLEILDTSGNDPFPAVHKLNIMSGDVFILPFSLDDIDSYNQVKNLCQEIREIKKVNRKKRNFPILILGNKLDTLKENRTRCVDVATVELFAAAMKYCIYADVSCRSQRGIEDAFQKLFTTFSIPIELLPTKHRRIYLNPEQTKTSHLSSHDTMRPVGETRSNRLMAFKEAHNNRFETREGSFKKMTKNIKRMTFRRTFNDARGVAYFNVRRPSIQTELKNLQKKSNVQKTNGKSKSKLEGLMNNLQKLMCLKFNRNH